MATLEEVARHCGVSTMTVSRVINNKGYVAKETRELVNKAIDELNYRPNLIARSLVTNRTSTIGVLMTRLENPVYSVIVSGLTQEAVKHDYDIILSTSSDVDSSLKSVNTLINKQIDALILLPMEIRGTIDIKSESYEESIKGIGEFYQRFGNIASEFQQENLPIVIIGTSRIENVSYYVNEDYRAGAVMAVEYLVEKGHRNIGYLHHQITDEGVWGERYQGFFEAMDELKCPVNPRNFESCIDTIESGYEAMGRLLSKCQDMTAVYCANDIIAVGAANAILSQGLRIPEDISIIGHDGSIYSETVHPRLTTVSIEPYEIGKQAFDLAKDIIDGECAVKEIVVLPKIIEGKSVKEIK